MPGNNAHSHTTDIVYFNLPTRPLRPDRGYIFSRTEIDADFQLPEEAPKTTSAIEFRIIVNESLEWTLIDESITGISVNDTRLCSAENRNLLALTGYHLSHPKSEMTLLTGKPNSIQVGWGGLHFNLHILSKAADYYYHHALTQPSQSNLFSPTALQPSPILTTSSAPFSGTHVLRTTEDIDAELHRQTGGDLTKGFCIDPARLANATTLGLPSVAARAGGYVDTGIDDQDWTVLAKLGQLSLQRDNGGFDAMES